VCLSKISAALILPEGGDDFWASAIAELRYASAAIRISPRVSFKTFSILARHSTT